MMANSCPPLLAGYANDAYLLSPQQSAPLYAGVAIDPGMIKYDPILGHIAPQTRLAYQTPQSSHMNVQVVQQPGPRRPMQLQSPQVVASIAPPLPRQPTHSQQRLASTGAYSSTNASSQSPAASSNRRRHSTTTSKVRADDEPNDEKTRIKKDIHNSSEFTTCQFAYLSQGFTLRFTLSSS